MHFSSVPSRSPFDPCFSLYLGSGKDEIKLQLEEGNVLHVRGKSPGATREEQQSKDAVWHLAERLKGEFSRRLELPENVRTEQIRAQVENGVLTIVVPKEPLRANPKAQDHRRLQQAPMSSCSAWSNKEVNGTSM